MVPCFVIISESMLVTNWTVYNGVLWSIMEINGHSQLISPVEISQGLPTLQFGFYVSRLSIMYRELNSRADYKMLLVNILWIVSKWHADSGYTKSWNVNERWSVKPVHLCNKSHSKVLIVNLLIYSSLHNLFFYINKQNAKVYWWTRKVVANIENDVNKLHHVQLNALTQCVGWYKQISRKHKLGGEFWLL